MASFRIEGGHKLSGEITPQGAKNEALQVICACLLTKEEVIMDNVPHIADIVQLIDLMQKMGVEVKQINKNKYSFKAENIDLNYIGSADYNKRCTSPRGSVMLLGPILARFKSAILPQPGGDKIGRPPRHTLPWFHKIRSNIQIRSRKFTIQNHSRAA